MSNLFTPQQAAALGFLVVEFADAYVADSKSLRPAPLAGSSLAEGWVIDGYLIANNVLFPHERDCVVCAGIVCYGVLAHRKDEPSKFVAAVRGTVGTREWLIDAKFLQTAHPIPGSGDVECGFYGVYDTMAFIPAAGPAVKGQTAWKGIKDVVGKGELIVTGHSLGAALATYLTYDLAKLGGMGASLFGCFFASPRPGDFDFVQAFDAAVAQYVAYDYVQDVVPDLPPGLFGYRRLPKVYELTAENAEAAINNDVASNHHLLCYCAMLSYAATPDWKKLLLADQDDPRSIRGPNLHEPAKENLYLG